MIYQPSGAYYCEFTTQRFDTGAAANADSLPTATATKNGTDDGSFSLTVTNIDTGRYKITGTVPAGYVNGDRFQVVVSATVNSVSGKGVVDNCVIDVATNTRSAPATAQTISSNADITAIKAETDNLPASPAAVSDIPSAATNAAAVRTNLTTELGRIDATISSRSAPATAQTISSNADITTILGRVDVATSTRLPTASYVSPPSAATNATAVRSELTTELGRIDVAISTRSAPGTAQTITAPADMALNSTVAKESTTQAAIAAIPAAPSAATIASQVQSTVVPGTGGLTVAQCQHIAAALAAAKLSGMVTGEAGTTVLRKIDDSGALISATQDANGNRSAMTVTP